MRERGNIGFYAEIVLKYTSLLCGFLLSKIRLESFQTSPDVFDFSKIHMLVVSQRLFNKSNLFFEKKLFSSKNSLSVLSGLCAERSLNVSKLNTQLPNSFH